MHLKSSVLNLQVQISLWGHPAISWLLIGWNNNQMEEFSTIMLVAMII